MDTMFNEILGKIEEYNNLPEAYGVPQFSKLFNLETGHTSTPEKISQLEAQSKTKFPESLQLFYQSVGNIESDGFNECNAINIFSTDYLLEHLSSTDKWTQIRSLGIIDMILYNWGNDRFEIDELDKQMVDNLNSQYHCFGTYSTIDGLESSTYLYFDQEGNFGSIFYHQDDFEDLQDSYLNPLMNNSLATQSFEELILESLDIIIKLKKEQLAAYD